MPYKPNPGIYSILNLQNGKIYIGSAVSMENRFCQHRRLLKKGEHFNHHLQSAWVKYGEEGFCFQAVESCKRDQEELLARENFWMRAYKANDRAWGYNKRLDASSNIGRTYSAEIRKKLSLAHMGHKRSPETHAKITAAQRKPVCKLLEDGTVVAEYPSLKDAAASCGVFRTAISMCLSGRLRTTGGYFWSHKSKAEGFIPKAVTIQRVKKTEVWQHKLNGEVVKWPSISDALKAKAASSRRVFMALKTGALHNNCTWTTTNTITAAQ